MVQPDSETWFIGDVLFSREEEEFRARLRAWLHANPPPQRPRNLDRAAMGQYCEWHATMVEAGFAGLNWPKAFGGQELDVGFQLVQLEELAKMDIDAKILMAGLTLIGPVLQQMGTESQQRRFLDDILYGRTTWCMLLSEPDAGSDLASVKTRGTVKDDGIHLNGQKTWSSRAHVSDYGVALFRTSESQSKSGGLTMAIIDLSEPGVTIVPLRQQTNQDEFNNVYFDDVLIPFDHVIGEVDQGWKTLMRALTNERAGMSVAGYTALVRSLEILRTNGMTGESSEARDAFVRVWSAVAAQRLTAQRSIGAARDPDEALAYASAAKLQFGRNAQALAEFALATMGTTGTAVEGEWDDLPWAAKSFLRSPAESIGGGTNEVQKNAIGERVLGLPR